MNVNHKFSKYQNFICLLDFVPQHSNLLHYFFYILKLISKLIVNFVDKALFIGYSRNQCKVYPVHSDMHIQVK